MLKAGLLATIAGLIANSLLCLLKLSVGYWASSLSVISDGVNSLTDAVSSLAILIAVNVSGQEPDEGHPFGHHRAEPIAGLIVAIFAGIAGFEVLKRSAVELCTGEFSMISGWMPFAVLTVSVLVKAIMSLTFYRIGRQLNSPAIRAGAMDSQMDILVSLTALAGVTGAYLGALWLDSLMALVISFFIFRAGYRIGVENINYLMGASPSPELLEKLELTIKNAAPIHEIDELKAHYVGNYVHVEIEVSIDGSLSTLEAHNLEETLRDEVERIPSVDKAFVHVNPR